MFCLHGFQIIAGQPTTRIDALSQTVSAFISQYVPEGGAVGIVQFDSSASVLAKITEIITDQDRQNLLDAVPINADGGTNIGSGLSTCHMVCYLNAADIARLNVLQSQLISPATVLMLPCSVNYCAPMERATKTPLGQTN